MKSEMNISPVLQSLWIYRAWVLLALLAMVSCVAALEFVELKNQISQKNAALDQVKQLTRINEDQNLRLLKLEKIVAKQSESMSTSRRRRKRRRRFAPRLSASSGKSIASPTTPRSGRNSRRPTKRP